MTTYPEKTEISRWFAVDNDHENIFVEEYTDNQFSGCYVVKYDYSNGNEYADGDIVRIF